MSDSNNLQLSQELKKLLNASSSVRVTKENLWKDDLAKRKEFAKTFTRVIGDIGVDAPAVIILDGEWGSGKTYFLQSLQHELDNEGYKAIYFDAFAEDFSADPLLAICGQLWKELSVGKSVSVKEKSDEELGNVMKDILGMVIKKDKLQDINTLDLGLLAQYTESRKTLAVLKRRLSSVVTKSDKPLVFIIDELDRCRPTFSLELLERVKHLFQVPGIVFVFGANKKSLMDSVKSEYGNQDQEYLQKFFDFELKLPKVIPSILAKQYVDKLKHDVIMSDFQGGEFKNLTDTGITDSLYYPLMDIMGVTLRQSQRSVQMLLHCLLISGSRQEWWYKMGTVACLTLLKVSRPELYADIAYNDKTCEEVIKKMSPVFQESANFNAIRRLTAADGGNPQSIVRYCYRFFNISICQLAEGEEKRRIKDMDLPKGDMINQFGLESEGMELVKKRFLARSEVIAMLENLDCRP